MSDPAEALAVLKRGVVDLTTEPELVERLRRGDTLRVKAGFDPTRPDLHLGHVVLMSKMAQFQRLGHHVIFIVGDFTAQVGDPTGKNKARPALTRDEVMEGARTYAEQAFKVLDREKTELRYNSEWLEKLTPQEFIKLAAKRTVARTMERDDFKKRFNEGREIHLHEFLYPLLQGYDSVAIDADIELGGTDQLFNLNVGRDLMTAYGKRPQMVMTVPLLEGLDARVVDGKVVGDKMSKSADNYVGVSEPAAEQFRKLMGVNDGVVWRYYELLSARSGDEIRELRRATEACEVPPREAQRRFAREVVERFHGAGAVESAERAYEQRASGGFPADAPRVSLRASEGSVLLRAALAEARLAVSPREKDEHGQPKPSLSEARRLIEAGAVQVDGAKVTDRDATLASGKGYEIAVGTKNRKYARVDVTD